MVSGRVMKNRAGKTQLFNKFAVNTFVSFSKVPIRSRPQPLPSAHRVCAIDFVERPH